MKNKIIAIVGPTASGKTEASMKIASLLNSEIISFDSMQIYKEIPIISQAPSKDELETIPHHLIGELSVKEEYSASQFKDKVIKIIEDIENKGKTPILVGGTGLYLKALIDGLFESPKKDEKLREKLQNISNEKLHEKLMEIDPKAAKKIHVNDKRRIIRAIEIYELTGISKTEHEKNTKGISSEYDVIQVGINMDRQKLYERINQRVDIMFDNGLIKEVQKIYNTDISITAYAALGIKEITGHLNGEYDLDTAKDMIKQNTRNYAKRQMTWFRADQRIQWFDTVDELVERIKNLQISC